jgi:hypothetical protein
MFYVKNKSNFDIRKDIFLLAVYSEGRKRKAKIRTVEAKHRKRKVKG